MRKFLSALLLGVLITSSPAALGHSSLVTSTPKSGVVIKTFPKNFSLTFNEEILQLAGKEPSRVRLFSPSQRIVALGKTTITGEVLTATVKAAKREAGRYRLTYRVVSADGHVITGEITFTYRP
jgi:methionine-rich copper-binding protein CopC